MAVPEVTLPEAAFPDVTLHDRYDLTKSPVLLNGTQALVRLMLMQAARDRAAGLDTAGYVTGYRGSPLGSVDMTMQRAERDLAAAGVIFQPGLNEDLAATALWGTQQAELRGEGKHDGVFGLWYGKGPGVDRSGDVLRHANMAGTSPHGGVVMCMGDDHTGESSTVCHQSDWALVDAYIPVLSPAGVQEILDFGLYGFALSRYAGVWAGLKLMKDTVEVTSVVDSSPGRESFVTPDYPLPEGGLSIRLGDHWIAQEERLVEHKRFAAEAFARANRIDRMHWTNAGARIGFVAAGKNWLDLVHAFSLLGIDEAEAGRLGLSTYKVGQVWPLDMTSFHEWAAGLDLIVVVEEKRKLIEVQVKEALFDDRNKRVYGQMKRGKEIFPVHFALDPVQIAGVLGEILEEEGCGSERLKNCLQRIDQAKRSDNAPEIASRLPYFCSGCPHNTSTKLPDGSRGYAGIGCHFMVQWMDRATDGFTHMGGEGANWIGEAPFSKRLHVFQNIGDGTYNHSGIQAIRAALSADTTITYKILFNDAVAMTGGQVNDGGLSAARIAAEVRAMGVRHLAVVYDQKEDLDAGDFGGLALHPRDELPKIQEKFRNIKGVSVILYVQTCAAEKRRRRKIGTFPDPDRRVWINPDVCEGCGDCGVQSNCVSVVPLETEFGTKREIDQSSCNKDYTCVKGFCPSFVTLEGARIRKSAKVEIDIGDLPEPALPAIAGTHNTVITGVGGTGVVTIGAVMAMAAHLDGKGVGLMEMAGLAQKGGAVYLHCRIARRPADIAAIRVSTGEADALIGGDLVVSAGSKTLGLTASGRTGAVVNAHETITGAFTRDRNFRIPGGRLRLALEARLQDRLAMLDSSQLALHALGDSIFSNMILLGAAWQAGLVPLTGAALRRAIELNGASVPSNLRAFEIGRWALVHPGAAARAAEGADPAAASPEAGIALRRAHLRAYQDEALARRYDALLARFEGNPRLREAVAKGYHKLLTYKDEYEVARLHLESAAKLAETFEGAPRMTFHLAPPILGGTGPDGRPKKRAFGPWMLRVFRVLAPMRRLRGTPADPFGYSRARRAERALIRQYEADMEELLRLPAADPEAAIRLALLPLEIRGFGPVKDRAIEQAARRREELLAHLRGNATQAAA